jgi:hypothetical protein
MPMVMVEDVPSQLYETLMPALLTHQFSPV